MDYPSFSPPLRSLFLFSFLSLIPPLLLSLIAVPLMPPAQSQPRPAASPQRFPVSSSCSYTHSPITRLALGLFVREISLSQLDTRSGPYTVGANL